MKNILLLSVTAISGLIISCGIKGPPLPPLKAADTQQVNSQSVSQDATSATPVKTPAKKTNKK